MKEIKKVQGSLESSQPLIIGKDTVYVHSNVRKLTIEELKKYNENLTDEELEKIDMYEYDEIQYTKDEYIKVQSNQITDLELAMIELYEGGTE